MYFGLNQSCAGGQHYMTLAWAASKETRTGFDHFFWDIHNKQFIPVYKDEVEIVSRAWFLERRLSLTQD